jgi:hypothetical protein
MLPVVYSFLLEPHDTECLPQETTQPQAALLVALFFEQRQVRNGRVTSWQLVTTMSKCPFSSAAWKAVVPRKCAR